MPDAALVSSATSLLVGLVAVALAVLALRARARSGSRNLAFVAAAFLVFAVKSAFSAYNVQTHVIAHDLIELGLSLFDLAILALLVLPLLLKADHA